MKLSTLFFFSAALVSADTVQTTNSYSAWAAQASQFGPVLSTNFPNGYVTIPNLVVTSEAMDVTGTGPGLLSLADGALTDHTGYWGETLYSTTLQLFQDFDPLAPASALQNAQWHGIFLSNLTIAPGMSQLTIYFETVTGSAYAEDVGGPPDPYGGYSGYFGDIGLFTLEDLDRVVFASDGGEVDYQYGGLAVADDAVPEPASVSLLLLGSALVIISIRRRKGLWCAEVAA